VLAQAGFLNTRADFDTVSPLLVDNGFCVFSINYGRAFNNPLLGGNVPMETSAHEFGAFVRRVLDVTHADKVDIVGHSEGTIMPRYWMNFLGGADKVDRYVMLTPAWKGTSTYGAAGATRLLAAEAPGLYSAADSALGHLALEPYLEVQEGSPFMTRLNRAGMALPGVSYTNIATKYDQLVTPYTDGFTSGPNVTNITLQNQCPVDFSEHITVAYDPTAMQDMLNGLDPEHARPAPAARCSPALEHRNQRRTWGSAGRWGDSSTRSRPADQRRQHPVRLLASSHSIEVEPGLWVGHESPNAGRHEGA
jgi:hypothetical protein